MHKRRRCSFTPGRCARAVVCLLAGWGVACAAGPAPAPVASTEATLTAAAPAADAQADWPAFFAREVPRRLQPPADEQARYAALAAQALQAAGASIDHPQFVLVVDRQALVQAALLYLAAAGPAPWQWIGAAPVATGRPGRFDHFLTPLGVHAHHPANPDFRAEGTRNEFGIRGYGRKGLRVFDFGWVDGQRTWDAGGTSPMRLQMHATDPDRLEALLGQRGSKGCVRIPSSLNRFLDRHGVLDADYDAALARGEHFWLFDAARQPNPLAGRWLVVLETERSERPDWAKAPRRQARATATATRC